MISPGRRASMFGVGVVLAPILAVSLFTSGLAGRVAPARAESRPEGVATPEVSQEERAVVAALEVEPFEEAVSGVLVDLAGLQSDLRADGERLSARVRVLDRKATASRETVSDGGRSPLRPTMSDLSGLLKTVAGALHSGDLVVGEIVSQLNALRRQEFELRELQAIVRQMSFEQARLERDLRAQLVEARRTAHLQEGGGSEDAGASVILSRLRDAALAGQELRRAEAELLGSWEALADRRARLLGEMERTEETVQELYGDMATAQVTAGEWASLLSDPDDWLDVVAGDGPFSVCPVDQPHAYTDDFGAPRYSGGFHLHQGIDIFAPLGTPVRAPFPGTAVAAPNRLGGEAVIVYGADGYVYNAHLSEYGTLGEVEAGTIIGYVGNTGNARTTAPHDHFEWHPDRGPAVNPFLFLNAVC